MGHSLVQAEMPGEEEGVEKQQADGHLQQQLRAGWSALRQDGAPQHLEQRRQGQHGGRVGAQDPPAAGEPLAQRGRRARARRDPPQLHLRRNAAQGVQGQVREAEEDVRQEGVRGRQARRLEDFLHPHQVPHRLENRLSMGCE